MPACFQSFARIMQRSRIRATPNCPQRDFARWQRAAVPLVAFEDGVNAVVAAGPALGPHPAALIGRRVSEADARDSTPMAATESVADRLRAPSHRIVRQLPRAAVPDRTTDSSPGLPQDAAYDRYIVLLVNFPSLFRAQLVVRKRVIGHSVQLPRT